MESLAALYRTLSPRRRRQFLLALALMVVGALAELLTIGAVLPFLVLITTPSRAADLPLVGPWLTAIGGDPVLGACLLLGASAVAAAAIRVLLTWYIHRFTTAVGHDLAARIFSRMLRQPYAAHVHRSSNEILSGIEKVQAVVSDILQPGLQGLVAAFIGLAITALLVWIDAFSALAAATATILAYVAISLAGRKRLRRNSGVISEAFTARMKVVQEGLGGIRDVILDRSQPLFEEKFHRADTRYRRAQSANAFIATAPRFVVEAAGIGAIALIAWTMSLQPAGIVAAIPTLGALALGAQRLLPLLHQAYAGITLSSGAISQLGDVVRLIEAPILEDNPPAGVDLPFDRAIRFDKVSYRHPEGDFALRDASFEIARGDRVGFAGPTGSGKSTLLDLLMGLLPPDSGTVSVDGRALDPGTRAAWQARIAHVPQSIYLADDSIAANIAFNIPAEKVDQARLRSVVAAAQLETFIAGLANGIATRVGERGIRLSGGQRQRIGIARALYRQAPVLILDEATNALDDATEAAVMRAINALSADITIVMIAHRMTTLEGCDQIIRMREGRVVAT